ncbi:vomeronasal type-2 receptor 26-like [Dendrobates tinctorius]|uniref:vomeronasal type-2 receptor 26-like n=1 Tax=Dendrobates tinctorius TaxID=92724 RepID=UPI003CC92A1B
MGIFSRYYFQAKISYLIFLFAIDNINKNPDILPNITLGYHLYDSCSDGRLAARHVLHFLSGPDGTIPNYSSMGRGRLVGVVGDQSSAPTMAAAQILGLYGYPQISYGSTDHSLSDRRHYPHVFRTVQNHHIHNMVITKLLKHFGWTWVGILISDDGIGENELQILTKHMREHGICVAFTIKRAKDGTFDNISSILKHPEFPSVSQVPVSRCSDPCSPGTWKKAKPTIHICCYDCVPCPEGEISNITDSESCMKCQSDKWPNETRDQCLPKVMEFISYQNDTMASVLSCISVFGCLVTGFTFGIFISYRDTPIVRANNRNLSYLLLVSIFLSFLSVFLFLGRPNDVTCRLRETSFGFFFSVAVSSLLAKTVIVCVAFKSTKPGSSWRKWLSVKLPYTIVLLCSSLQVVICVFWLSISPPFQDLDAESYPGILIIQCNEGSDIWFYSMLGYLGLLAAVSFALAFMVRTLPDSFNEAKYITFSMLVFISVWISMIPAYLSTRGKTMVAVEIFAVMASSAGLLGCVFFPKCFIILFRSEINTKAELLGKRKK